MVVIFLDGLVFLYRCFYYDPGRLVNYVSLFGLAFDRFGILVVFLFLRLSLGMLGLFAIYSIFVVCVCVYCLLGYCGCDFISLLLGFCR